jgi:hypothetical protein
MDMSRSTNQGTQRGTYMMRPLPSLGFVHRLTHAPCHCHAMPCPALHLRRATCTASEIPTVAAPAMVESAAARTAPTPTPAAAPAASAQTPYVSEFIVSDCGVCGYMRCVQSILHRAPHKWRCDVCVCVLCAVCCVLDDVCVIVRVR